MQFTVHARVKCIWIFRSNTIKNEGFSTSSRIFILERREKLITPREKTHWGTYSDSGFMFLRWIYEKLLSLEVPQNFT